MYGEGLMAKRKENALAPVKSAWFKPPKWGLHALAGLAVGVGLIAGLIWLGRLAGLTVADRDRYAIPTAAIETTAPPGSEPSIFLTEVRYLGQLPEQLSLVDPDTETTIRKAFRQHPWVEEIESVKIGPGPTIRVKPVFRTPTLVVPTSGEPPIRVVDSGGVLLPTTTPTAGLAKFVGKLPDPSLTAGEAWPDPDVVRAAELAKAYKAQEIEKTAEGWRITDHQGRNLTIGW